MARSGMGLRAVKLARLTRPAGSDGRTVHASDLGTWVPLKPPGSRAVHSFPLQLNGCTRGSVKLCRGWSEPRSSHSPHRQLRAGKLVTHSVKLKQVLVRLQGPAGDGIAGV